MGKRALILGLLFAFSTPARATVIVQDTFEGSPCIRSPFWNIDSRPKSAGGDGPEIGGTVNGVSPQGGSCYVYHHYRASGPSQPEDSSYLYSDQANWPNSGDARTARSWHFVYWAYFDSAHSGTFAHPIHQKLGKWYVKPTWAQGASDCSATSNPCAIPNIGHVRSVSGLGTTDPMQWESHMEQYGSVEPSGSCGFSDNSNGTQLSFNQWHKIEGYVNLRGTCTGGAGSCAGCSDQIRVWVDGTLVSSADNWNANLGRNSGALANFWILGNGSASGQPFDYWLYADNICIGTSYNDCTEAPFGGTRAQAEFGGGGGDTTAPAKPQNVRIR